MSNVGYIRVSSSTQNTVRQLDGIALDHIFEEKISAKNTDREQLKAMIAYVREGDTVHVHSIDRLARNIVDLNQIVKTLNDKKVSITFHKENMTFSHDTSNSMNNLLFNILGSFAEFERELILERQREGIAKAKEQGKYKGRSRKVTDTEILNLIEAGMSFRKTAEQLNVSLSTVQRVVKASKE